jgi:hypothetical protein
MFPMTAAPPTPNPSTPELRAAAPILAARFAAIITPLLPIINLFEYLLGPLVITVHNRFSRARSRLASVMARYAAGNLQTRAQKPRKGGPREQIRIPTSRNWLYATFCRNEARRPTAALYRGQLEALLNEPEFAELIAIPQAARILRPLCRMLGIAAPAIPSLPPRKPRPPKPPKATYPRPRKLTRAEKIAILWYPNHEGKPMQLLPPRRSRRPI